MPVGLRSLYLGEPMKTYRLTSPFNPDTLSNELVAAGIVVETIRASHAELNEPAMYGVIVTSDAANDATVASTVSSHTPVGSCSRTPTAGEMEPHLSSMEQL